MRAVRLVLFAEARHRWRSWLALGLLVAVVGGVAMAGATAGRRTSTAYPRFAATYGFDAAAYSGPPLVGLGRIANVVSVVPVTGLLGGTPSCACGPINPSYFAVDELPAHPQHLMKLLAGRLPNPNSTTEVLASVSLAQQPGVHIGTVITVPFYAASQLEGTFPNFTPTGRPRGPVAHFRIVGIEATVYEFPSIGSPSYDLWTTPAFVRRAHAPPLFTLTLVKLRHGPLDQGAFQAAALKHGAIGVLDVDSSQVAVENSLHPQAVGWWLLAAIATVAGLAAMAQAFARQTRVVGETSPTLSALGVDSGQLFIVNLGRAVLVGMAGAAGAVLLAVLLSPLTPVGEARDADPSSGLFVDPVVLGVGAAAIVVGCLVVSLWPAWRSARVRGTRLVVPRASSAVVNRLAAMGAPPTAVVGVRRALERGNGRDAVPVVGGLLGTVVVVLALTGTAVFGNSLTHLTTTPALYGQRFDVYLSANGNGDQSHLFGPVLSALRKDPAITAVTKGASAEVLINHHTVDAIAGTAARGPLLLSIVQGHLPTGVGQVVLGESTLREVGAAIGSTVQVAAPRPTGGERISTFTVVGTVSFPTAFGISGLGNGAEFTIPGLVAAQCPPGPAGSTCRRQETIAETQALLIKAAPTAAGRAALARYERQNPNDTNLPAAPISLVNFGEAVNFPLIVGLMLALFGAASLLHTLVVSTARRRAEVGLLKALGFQRSQIAGSVGWQATTIGLVGVALGVPLGIAAGNAVWRAFASSIGVVPDTVVLAWVVVAVAGGVLILANLLALGPAFVTSRLAPARLLRTQ